MAVKRLFLTLSASRDECQKTIEEQKKTIDDQRKDIEAMSDKLAALEKVINGLTGRNMVSSVTFR